jgi:hypothetical protein
MSKNNGTIRDDTTYLKTNQDDNDNDDDEVLYLTRTDIVLPSQTRGKVYICGYASPASANLFPDYEFIATPWNPRIHSSTTPDDVLVFGMHGPCAVTSVPEIASKFHGKILFSNGEPIGNVFQDNKAEILRNPDKYINRVYQMGPYPPEGNEIFINNNTKNNGDDVVSKLERENSIQIHFMATILYAHFYILNITQMDWLIDPNQRRHNTGKFNAIIYLTGKCYEFRQLTAITLAQSYQLHHGNGCKIQSANATISPIATGRLSWVGNHEIFYQYKYCLVMENTNMKGYVTEKLLFAFMGGCLPIYYGSGNEVFDEFTDGSYIYYDIDNPQPAIELFQQTTVNQTLYEEMLSRPILKNGLKTVDKYFSIYPEVAHGKLNKKLRRMMNMTTI